MLKKLKLMRKRTKITSEIRELKTQHYEAIHAWKSAHANDVDKSEERELAKFANKIQFKLIQKQEELQKISV